MLEVGDAVEHFQAQALADLREPFAYVGDQRFDRVQPLADGGLHLLALPGACGLQARGGLGEQLESRFVQRLGVGGHFLDHARPPHQ